MEKNLTLIDFQYCVKLLIDKNKKEQEQKDNNAQTILPGNIPSFKQ